MKQSEMKTRERVIKRVKERLEMMRRADNSWADLYMRDVTALLRLLGELPPKK